MHACEFASVYTCMYPKYVSTPCEINVCIYECSLRWRIHNRCRLCVYVCGTCRGHCHGIIFHKHHTFLHPPPLPRSPSPHLAPSHFLSLPLAPSRAQSLSLALPRSPLLSLAFTCSPLPSFALLRSSSLSRALSRFPSLSLDLPRSPLLHLLLLCARTFTHTHPLLSNARPSG